MTTATQLAALPESLRAIVPLTAWPRRGYRTRDFADDLCALLGGLRIESTVVVGHSMGTTIARRFAVDHRSARVRSWSSTPSPPGPTILPSPS